MTKISNYEELMEEKQRLKLLLQTQKLQIHQDFREVKEQFEPVRSIVSFASKMISKEPGNLLMTGTANTIIDLVLKKFLLARTGWFTRVVVPFLVKNYASHFIADKKDNIIQKITSFFKKKHASNGHPHYTENE